MNYEHILHPIPPFYDRDSKILVLGSFPSIKTRESGFFYGHPQNRFWKLMSLLFEGNGTACPGKDLPGQETLPFGAVPVSPEEKKAFAARHHIALWDSIRSCDIVGSSDS